MDTTATDSFRHDNSATTPQACHGAATVDNAVRGRLNSAVLRTSNAYGHLLLGRRKRRLFANLPPTVVEIGPGTGANLRYYRPGARPWRWFFEGCDVLRDTEATLARTGWAHLEVQRYHVPTLFLPINTQIAGTALRTNPGERR